MAKQVCIYNNTDYINLKRHPLSEKVSKESQSTSFGEEMSSLSS